MNPENPSSRSARVHDEINFSTFGPSRPRRLCNSIISFLMTISAVCFLVAVFFVLVSPFVCLFLWAALRASEDAQIRTTTLMNLVKLDFSDDYNGSSSLQSLNVTFSVDMELMNKGVTGGMKFKKSTMFLRYKGMVMDMVPISASARVAQRRSRNVSLPLNFESHRLLAIVSNSSSAMYPDLASNNGVLWLQTRVRFSGKGRSVLLFMVYPVAEKIHDLFLNLTSRTFTYRECVKWPNDSDLKPLCLK